MADEDDGQVVVDMVKVEFANRTDFGEDKVNDGRNFQGLMNHKDYMKRKEELTEEPVDPVEDAAKRQKIDDLAKSKAEEALRLRMEKKKIALQKELQREGDASKEISKDKKSKRDRKSKKKGEVSAGQLSFDVEDEGDE